MLHVFRTHLQTLNFVWYDTDTEGMMGLVAVVDGDNAEIQSNYS